MSKKDMPKFDSLLLGSDESDISNDSNRDWWQSNPMTYDWDKSLGEPVYNKHYFQKIDDIFGEGHSLINNPRWPDGFILENFIDYNVFKSKNVLEIGCGAGLVSSHIAKAGAKLHAIDLTNEAIIMTKERFSLENLEGNIGQMDAEHMEFESDSMDYIVSWGVIHHSSNMQAIIDEIHRVLKPGGEAYIMVYNKLSLRYQIYVKFWLGIMKLKFLTKSTEEIAGTITDGFIARHLTSDDFKKTVSNFSSSTISFSDEKTTTLKYLFGVGRIFAPFYPITQYFERWLARKWGWYLEAKIKK